MEDTPSTPDNPWLDPYGEHIYRSESSAGPDEVGAPHTQEDLLREELSRKDEIIKALQAQNRSLLRQLIGPGDHDIRPIIAPDGTVQAEVVPRLTGDAIAQGEAAASRETSAETLSGTLRVNLILAAQAFTRAANLDFYRGELAAAGTLRRGGERALTVNDPHRQTLTVAYEPDGTLSAKARIDDDPIPVPEATTRTTAESTNTWKQRRQEVAVATNPDGTTNRIEVTTYDSTLAIKETKREANMTNDVQITQVVVDLARGLVKVRGRQEQLANGLDIKGVIRRRLNTKPYDLDDVGEPLHPKKKPPFAPNTNVRKRMASATLLKRSALNGKKWPLFGSHLGEYRFIDIARHDGKVPPNAATGDSLELGDFISAASQRVLEVIPQV